MTVLRHPAEDSNYGVQDLRDTCHPQGGGKYGSWINRPISLAIDKLIFNDFFIWTFFKFGPELKLCNN